VTAAGKRVHKPSSRSDPPPISHQPTNAGKFVNRQRDDGRPSGRFAEQSEHMAVSVKGKGERQYDPNNGAAPGFPLTKEAREPGSQALHRKIRFPPAARLQWMHARWGLHNLFQPFVLRAGHLIDDGVCNGVFVNRSNHSPS
jgi:hypothetical protein